MSIFLIAMVMDKLILKCGICIDLEKLRAGTGEPRETGDIPLERRGMMEKAKMYINERDLGGTVREEGRAF